MRFYDIALFMILFNLTLGFLQVAIAPYTDYSIGSIEGFGTEADIKAAEAQISKQVSDPSNEIFPELNFLVENVRLAIQGVATFLSFFANATILFPIMWNALAAPYVGGSELWPVFLGILSTPFYVIYLFAIIQWSTGRSARDAQ